MTIRLRSVAAQVAVASCVSVVALAVYDARVRVPQTPRLAVVDVNALYAASQRSAAHQAMALVDRSRTEQVGDQVAAAALQLPERVAGDFGPRLERQLAQLATECQCTVVAMAAVHGAHSGIANYTGLIAQRLGLQAPPQPEAVAP
jgi:hypothetical protein